MKFRRARKPAPVPLAARVAVGDFYEDCSYEPMVCLSVDYDEDDLTGVSLVNGRIGSCSLRHCGVVRLSVREMVAIRGSWPPAHLVDSCRARNGTLNFGYGEFPADAITPGQAGVSDLELQDMLDRIPAD